MSKNDNGLLITTDDEADIIKIIESNFSDDDKYVDFTGSPLLIKRMRFLN